VVLASMQPRYHGTWNCCALFVIQQVWPQQQSVEPVVILSAGWQLVDQPNHGLLTYWKYAAQGTLAVPQSMQPVTRHLLICEFCRQVSSYRLHTLYFVVQTFVTCLNIFGPYKLFGRPYFSVPS